MATRLAKSATKTTVKIHSVSAPKVKILGDALAKMELYIDGCNDEIGWLHAAKRVDDGTIVIYDSILFPQEVHATTTEISPEGLAEFGMQLLSLPNGMDLWNDMRGWGHSHVHMATNPSGQDDSQMDKFAQSGFPWFLRLIGNKKGDLRIDLYDYEKGLIFLDVEWYRENNVEEMQIYKEIKKLEAEIDKLEKQALQIEVAQRESFKPSITTEIANKVRKKSYTNYSGSHYAGRTGGHVTYGSNGGILEDTTSKKNVGTSTVGVGTSDSMAGRAGLVVMEGGANASDAAPSWEWSDLIDARDILEISDLYNAYEVQVYLKELYPEMLSQMTLDDRWDLLNYARKKHPQIQY